MYTDTGICVSTLPCQVNTDSAEKSRFWLFLLPVLQPWRQGWKQHNELHKGIAEVVEWRRRQTCSLPYATTVFQVKFNLSWERTDVWKGCLIEAVIYYSRMELLMPKKQSCFLISENDWKKVWALSEISHRGGEKWFHRAFGVRQWCEKLYCFLPTPYCV